MIEQLIVQTDALALKVDDALNQNPPELFVLHEDMLAMRVYLKTMHDFLMKAKSMTANGVKTA